MSANGFECDDSDLGLSPTIPTADSSSSINTTTAPELERRRHRKKQRLERKRRDRANHFRVRSR